MIFSYFCIILEKNKADQMLICTKDLISGEF